MMELGVCCCVIAAAAVAFLACIFGRIVGFVFGGVSFFILSVLRLNLVSEDETENKPKLSLYFTSS